MLDGFNNDAMKMNRGILWLQWAVANAMPLFVMTLSAKAIGKLVSSDYLSLLLYVLVSATLVTAQWFVIRSRINRDRRWAFATIGGIILGVIVSMPVMATADLIGYESIAVVAGNAIGGAMLGATQWMVLRQEVRRASRWVLASSITWLLVAAIGAGLYKVGWRPASEEVQFPGYRELAFLVWLLVGYGIATGWALTRILHQRRAENQMIGKLSGNSVED